MYQDQSAVSIFILKQITQTKKKGKQDTDGLFLYFPWFIQMTDISIKKKTPSNNKK